jgi:hypothetical protein
MEDRWLESLGSIRSQVHRTKTTTLTRSDIERIFHVRKESARQLIHLIHSVSQHTEKADKRLSVSIDEVKSFLSRFPDMPNNASRDARKDSIKVARELMKRIKPARRSAAAFNEAGKAPTAAPPAPPSEPNSNSQLIGPFSADLIATITEAAGKKGLSPTQYVGTLLCKHVDRLAANRKNKDKELPESSGNSTLFEE